MKLDELVEKYIAYKVLAGPTQRTYRACARNFVNTLKYNPQIEDISEEMVLEFRKQILHRSTAVTYNNNRRHLSALFKFAVIKEYVSCNLFSATPKAIEPRPKPKTVPLDALAKATNWITKLNLTSQKSSPPWATPPVFWHAFLTTLYLTGMRKRQIQYLQWQHISFDKKTIHLSSESSKNKRSWDIPLHPVVEMALQVLKVEAGKLGANTTSTDLVFAYRLARPLETKYDFTVPITYQLIRKFFENLSKIFNVHIRCHRIRHTTGTELMRNTNNPKLVQELLGHTSLSTTMIYVHPSMDDLRNLINTI